MMMKAGRMPGKSERHRRARSVYDSYYGSQPARSSERAAAAADDVAAGEDAVPSGRRAPGRKDKTRCKAARGGPHVSGLVVVPPVWSHGPGECAWQPRWRADGGDGWEVRWACFHEERCLACGKVSRALIIKEECPDYPGTPAQRAEAEAEMLRITERITAWRLRYKKPPPVTGRQGYRRKRDKGHE